jgi:protein AroM
MDLGLIAAVTIGQTPRPDLLEPLVDRVGSEARIIALGALDELTAADIATRSRGRDARPAGSPLTTRLRDGSAVTLDEADLAPLVQAAVDRADRAGADVTLLLCAGGFEALSAEGTLVRPSEAAAAAVRDIDARRVAVVVPYPGQAASAERKWLTAGFDAVAIVGDLPGVELSADLRVDAVVLDYVGHPGEAVRAFRATAPALVVDLGECGAEAAVRALRHGDEARPATVR